MTQQTESTTIRTTPTTTTTLAQVLFKTGHPEMATMIFEEALADDVDELNSFAAPKLDLHNHTVSTAL